RTYPDGPWGNESHIRRGGTVYDFRVPGDPLTPGWASLPGAKRIAARDAISLPKIISAPLSWRDARVILETMQGPAAPEAWQGGADGARAIARRARQTRRAPEAHDRVRQLGCGGIHPHLVYGMGRRARARTDRSCSGVSERRHGRPGHDVRRDGGAVAQPGDQRIRGDGARRSRGVGRSEEST